MGGRVVGGGREENNKMRKSVSKNDVLLYDSRLMCQLFGEFWTGFVDFVIFMNFEQIRST